ncbi:MAG: DNA gyrase subunit A [Candidatus Sungbacteria bacterium]|uniref:DNA topoisomerase (ATP-hydrolyzing) n=1 Tax=Candidatus Sungiibacteriota bacterium TaxID=2750080 RepID=A0A932YXP4_9BACT|nr:DNA gyrase subunit A [Candidatus Sungbacteria bacterium]
MTDIGKIAKREITDEMRESYIDYAMSVIVARALPDVRDGLKPVHRRILYAMQEMGLRPGAKYQKSAKVVGYVLGQYHPHGDSAAYESMVRMAQDFSLRYPLVDGQGNFGCFTKDTNVALADGRKLSFGELVEENQQGRTHYTYTINARGLVSVAKIKNPRMTRAEAQIIKVVLDTGEEIRCTPNHRFLLRGGSYKEAKDLTPEDSLMPLYQRLSEKTDRLNREGYLLIYQPRRDEWVPAHHLADTYNLTHRRYNKSDGRVRHHVDFNKLNNTPDNIRRLHWGEHWKVHYRHAADQHGHAPFWETGIKKYFEGNPELVQRAVRKNHRVIRVELNAGREAVYDLTIDGTHNFALAAGVFVHNSIDGDSAAAYRYTEARLAPIAAELLADIDKDTVDFRNNFDATVKEPVVLPARIPNLLINGSMGIAVGMATSIPPHNLGEVVDAALHLILHPDATPDALADIIQGPDFPTGGIIFNATDIRSAYTTGRGAILTRGAAEVVEEKQVRQIIITEIPYQVVKAELVEKIAELVREKKIEGIKDLRDESDKEGLRIAIDLKADAFPQKVLNSLYKFTDLEKNFNVNMLALVDGIQPQVLPLKGMLAEFLKHRQAVVTRRTRFDLTRARERIHILEGLTKALDHIDAVIQTIKKSPDREAAHQNLKSKFDFSDAQAAAILDMRLATLAGLERQKIEHELKEKQALARELDAILKDPKKILAVITGELAAVKKTYGDERKTRVVKTAAREIATEDIIPEEEMIIIMTRGGYIKRLRPEAYRLQRRGGKGIQGIETKEEDVVEHFLTANTHDDLLFFTSSGKVFQIKTYEIPEGSRTAKGKAIFNFLSIRPDEQILSIVAVPRKSKRPASGDLRYLALVTAHGMIKKVDSRVFDNVRRSGIVAITLKKGDLLKGVALTAPKDELLLVTARGQAIRFRESDARAMGRAASGVKAMRLRREDRIVGVNVIASGGDPNAQLLVVMDRGFGKKTPVKEYKRQRRGGAGIKTAKLTAKNGAIVSTHLIRDAEELIAISQKGQVIRTALKDVPALGRATQGVRIMRLGEGDRIASTTTL